MKTMSFLGTQEVYNGERSRLYQLVKLLQKKGNFIEGKSSRL